jgi:hypothetical protein
MILGRGKKDTTTREQATFLRTDQDGTQWVRLNGSSDETPVNGRTLASAKAGDIVEWSIDDGMLSITGNATTPAVGSSYVDGEVNVVVKQVDAIRTEVVETAELVADKASVGQLEAEYARIDSLQAATADIDTIRANSAKVQNLTAAQLEADHATIGTLDTTYMHANMSNADVAWIQNGTIKDGSIVSAMINDVSANKLTAGTINGSVINVTNLNADNITTGTINGQRIGEGSLSLSKLEDDVYTESEVDGKLATMQAEIDGAIETWTGTEVPTLNNTPASGWTTADERDRHVGDVYFVVNSQSQQNGYNYRFTKSGSTYSWQLIKDNDVTNALQRLTTAEGKITTFDSDISTLKTDTGTLKTKTQSLETSLGDKVDVTTFNSLEDTVDGHTQTLSQHTTAISNKADSSTVTAVTNRVSKNEQDISGLTTSVGQLQNTVATKADGSTVQTIANNLSTLEQDVDGFKTTVSETYATKVETKLTNEAEGNIISVNDAMVAPAIELRVNGASTQDGTPTPDAPVEIRSVENPVLHVSDGTTDTAVNLPVTLRSLPDGTKDTLTLTYLRPSTREGWAWYSGSVTRVVGNLTMDGTTVAALGRRLPTSPATASRGYIYLPDAADITAAIRSNFRSDTFHYDADAISTADKQADGMAALYQYSGRPAFLFCIEGELTVAEINAWLAENMPTLDYPLATPATETLPEIELPIFPSEHVTLWATADATPGLYVKYWTKFSEDIENRVSSAESSITQNAQNIALKVSESDVTGNYLIGKINLNSTTASIAAQRINLQGAVTISDLATDASTALTNAAKTATSYVTDIMGGGIMVHPSGDQTTGVQVTSDVDILRDGSSVINIGTDDAVRVGTSSGYHVGIDSDSLDMVDSSHTITTFVSDVTSVDEGTSAGSKTTTEIIVEPNPDYDRETSSSEVSRGAGYLRADSTSLTSKSDASVKTYENDVQLVASSNSVNQDTGFCFETAIMLVNSGTDGAFTVDSKIAMSADKLQLSSIGGNGGLGTGHTFYMSDVIKMLTTEEVSLTRGSGASSWGAGQLKRSGKTIVVTVQDFKLASALASGSNSGTIATIPTGYRPDAVQRVPAVLSVNGNYANVWAAIGTSGAIVLSNHSGLSIPTTAAISLNCCYIID